MSDAKLTGRACVCGHGEKRHGIAGCMERKVYLGIAPRAIDFCLCSKFRPLSSLPP